MHLDKRGIVKQSTRVKVIDDPRGRRAARVGAEINALNEAFWLGLAHGREAEARASYLAARKRARMAGFDYVPASDIASGPVEEILRRMETIMRSASPGREGQDVAALLGGVKPPVLMLSSIFTEYESNERAGMADLSPGQRRKWGAPKKRALASLIALIGDKPVTQITRNDALDFRSWWQDQVIDENLSPGTANKDFGHISTMLAAIDRHYRLGLEPVFSDMRLAGEKKGQRSAFEPAFVEQTLLRPGALGDLNAEARDVLYLIAETGLRLSEAVNLTGGTIYLDSPVPYVSVRPDGRRMKTEHSARDIPLVGVALEAAKRNPEGFPRYADNAASLSAIVNKVLGAHKLRPTPGHSLYSLRHTFEDRLTAVEAPDKLIAMLMGHRFARPKYGVGPSLEQKQKWLLRIVFNPPTG